MNPSKHLQLRYYRKIDRELDVLRLIAYRMALGKLRTDQIKDIGASVVAMQTALDDVANLIAGETGE